MRGVRRAFDQDAIHGNNRRWLGGRSLTGPFLGGILGTSAAIFVASGIAFGISFPWLLRNHTVLASSLLAVFSLSLLASLASGWLTGTTDPGIIPRAAAPPPDIARNPGRPRERRLTLRGRQIVVKYCETCRIWRPPHASHCATCDNCVDRFDHHCPYCSGCIGRRNYRSFLSFVVSTAVLSAVAVAAAVAHLVLKTRQFTREGDGDALSAFGKTLGDGPTAANVVVIVIGLVGLLFTACLSGFHAYLMWNNVTTAESLKKSNRNSTCDEDDLRGLRAIWFLITTRRPQSRLTVGYEGDSHPDAHDIAMLIEKQEEDDALAQGQTYINPQGDHHPAMDGARPELSGERVPSAASRIAKLSENCAVGGNVKPDAGTKI